MNINIEGPVRDIPIRIYKPNDLNEGTVLLYLHGGGWILGNLDTHDRVMRLLADFSGARVVGVDYALSPEYKFPVAINEVRAVLDWLQAHGPDHGLDSARLGIGGDSAGANLAVSVTQLCHQQSPGLIQFLLLYYGAYGLTESASWQQYGNAEFEFTREEKVASNNGLSRNQEDWLLQHYFNGPISDQTRHGFEAMKCASLLRETLWSMVSEIHSQLDFDFVEYTRENLERFDQQWNSFSA